MFKNEVQAFLVKQFYNGSDGTNGRENLLVDHMMAPNGLTRTKSLTTATRQAVLAAPRAKAATESTTSAIVTPDINTNKDAQGEADRQLTERCSVTGM